VQWQYFAALLLNNDYYAIRLQEWFGDALFGKVALQTSFRLTTAAAA
jgi:hypothetical protein